jgi:outer membrane protein assembly factor BamB
MQGICCAPLVEGERLWFVTSRGEVKCLDTQGFHDGENDGPFTSETQPGKNESDVIWVFDMMGQLGVSQHNMCSCSVTSAGNLLFVCTSNGVDESHINIPNTAAPSFMAMNKNTGKVLWTSDAPGKNIMHGQWSSPAYAVLGGVPQVMFAGGDGYLYSFVPEGKDGKAEILWKFDCNPKESKYILGGRGTRNEMIGTPVVYKDRVYVAVGQDPEHGEGNGHLWCIDPTKRGDVSSELAFNSKDPKTVIPHKRLQAVVKEEGDFARPNPNSAVVWHYSEHDLNGDGKIEFEETMHRTCGTAVIKDDILYLADFSGLFHCVDALTGKPYWTHDMLAASWGSALVVDGKVYVGDEDGDITVCKHGKKLDILSEVNMGNSVYSTPVVANNTLFIANKTHLFAIQQKD